MIGADELCISLVPDRLPDNLTKIEIQKYKLPKSTTPSNIRILDISMTNIQIMYSLKST